MENSDNVAVILSFGQNSIIVSSEVRNQNYKEVYDLVSFVFIASIVTGVKMCMFDLPIVCRRKLSVSFVS